MSGNAGKEVTKTFSDFYFTATGHTVKFYVKIKHVHSLPWWQSILRCAMWGQHVFIPGLKQPQKYIPKNLFAGPWLLIRPITGHSSSTIRLQFHFSSMKLLVILSNTFRACLVSSVSSSVAANSPAILILSAPVWMDSSALEEFLLQAEQSNDSGNIPPSLRVHGHVFAFLGWPPLCQQMTQLFVDWKRIEQQ